jgi:alanine racemase
LKTPSTITDERRRAWVEVDLDALRRNVRRLVDRAGAGVGVVPMVKADGYGLGAARIARVLRREPSTWALGVATVEEGAELRAVGCDGRIVVFFPCATRDADDLVEHRLEPAVSSVAALEAYAGATGPTRTLPVHLEVDTGMGRSGLVAARREQWMPEVRSILERGGLELASTFTHLHSAESDDAETDAQADRFRETLAALRRAGVDPGPVHLANSAAALRRPDLSADVVRPGLCLFGGLGGEPVAHVRARILDVRRVPEGHTVSYGASFRTSRPSRLATLGIGYGDGLRRELSNRGEALVEGRRTPIRGEVCMDVTVVDVTDVPGAEAGGVATLMGRDGGEEIGLEQMASACGTIPYEILTGLGGRLPRVDAGEAAAEVDGEGAA